MKNNKLITFLDAGHGSLDAFGRYTTAPGKQYQHNEGDFFHNNGWFYEGVWNRMLVDRVAEKLDHFGIPYLKVHHPYLDTPLTDRVEKANYYHCFYDHSIYISTHANASNGKARGYEVYSSPNTTPSDWIAEMHWHWIKELIGRKIIYRTDTSDGDHDKEACFFVLTKTIMPSILIEHLFFDNIYDARLLFDEWIIEQFVEAQVRTILDYYQTL
jgi:N-acetylmuramoyl-L-alanine amidase